MTLKIRPQRRLRYNYSYIQQQTTATSTHTCTRIRIRTRVYTYTYYCRWYVNKIFVISRPLPLPFKKIMMFLRFANIRLNVIQFLPSSCSFPPTRLYSRETSWSSCVKHVVTPCHSLAGIWMAGSYLTTSHSWPFPVCKVNTREHTSVPPKTTLDN